jgi:hypothetical protein
MALEVNEEACVTLRRWNTATKNEKKTINKCYDLCLCREISSLAAAVVIVALWLMNVYPSTRKFLSLFIRIRNDKVNAFLFNSFRCRQLFFLIMARLHEMPACLIFGMRIIFIFFYCFSCCFESNWLTWYNHTQLRMMEWEMRESYCLCLAFIWFYIRLTAYDSFRIIACRFHCHNLFLHPSNSRHHVALVLS